MPIRMNFQWAPITMLVLVGILTGCASAREGLGRAGRGSVKKEASVELPKVSADTLRPAVGPTISRTASSRDPPFPEVKSPSRAPRFSFAKMRENFWVPKPRVEVQRPQIEIVKQERVPAGQDQIAFERARHLESLGDWSAARKVYGQLMKNNPQWCEPIHRSAVCADQQGNHREAERFYRRALEIKPSKESLLSDLGYCYYLQGDWAAAEAILTRASELAPTDPKICNNLGLVYGRLGKAGKALQTFRRVSSEADAQHNLAVVMAGYEERQSNRDAPVTKVSWEESLKTLYAKDPIETSRVPTATKLR